MMLATFAAMSLTMNAQINEGTAVRGISNYDFAIPKTFTYDGKAYLQSRLQDKNNNTTTFAVYNDELEEIKSFTAASYDMPQGLFYDLDDNTFPDLEFNITQTLFNEDEKFEYLLFTKNGSRKTGFRIISDDGTELQSVSFNTPDINYWEDDYVVLKINGKFYLTFTGQLENSQGLFAGYGSACYRINPSSTEIKAVANVPISFAGRYTADGRRLTRAQRGINIVRKDDGTTSKVLVK